MPIVEFAYSGLRTRLGENVGGLIYASPRTLTDYARALMLHVTPAGCVHIYIYVYSKIRYVYTCATSSASEVQRRDPPVKVRHDWHVLDERARRATPGCNGPLTPLFFLFFSYTSLKTKKIIIK